MAIGCCSSFKKCSDAGVCIKLDDPSYVEIYKDCYYATNLEKGLNFYTEYNENNKARAEEYKRKQENNTTTELSKGDIVDVSCGDTTYKGCEVTGIYNDKVRVHPSDKPKDTEEDLHKNGFWVTDKQVTQSTEDIPEKDDKFKDKYKNAYIVVNGRQFYIGKRGGYGGYTYALGSDGIEKLKENIGELPIEIDTEFIESKFVDECGTESDRADWKPHVKIGDTEYNLMNSNIRGLKENTCRMLAEYFAELGLKTICECIGNSKKSFTYTQNSQPRKTQNTKPKEVKVENKVEEEINVQLSLFDF